MALAVPSADRCQRLDSVDCGCAVVFGDLEAEHHRWLVNLSNSASTGDLICLVELMQYIESSVDHEYEPGRLEWNDFRRFVGMHSVDNQAAMYWLAEHLEESIERRIRDRDALLESLTPLA